MAALYEPVPISVEQSLFDIIPGREYDTVIISNKTSFINILKLSDHKLIASLPVRVGVNISSAAVWNEKKQEYLLVQNKKDVYIWAEGQTLLDKAKKRQIPLDIHRLFSLQSYEPLVLCDNGTVAFLSDILGGTHQERVLSDSEDIVWSFAKRLSDGACVIYISSSKEVSPIANYRISTTWWFGKDGTLKETLLTEASTVEGGPPIMLRGVLENCTVFCLSDNDLAVVGLQRHKQSKQDTVGLAILDRKFGQVRAWQPFPFKKNFTQAFCLLKHIFVHCEKTLYMYRYECQMSTLANMIGHHQGMLVEEEYRPVHLHLSPEKRNNISHSMEEHVDGNFEVAKILNNLADPVKTSSYTCFKREFAQLKCKLQEQEVWAYLPELTLVLRRCCSEKKFWPSEELEFLITQHCVPASHLVLLFEALLRRRDVQLMFRALTLQTDDLPESCLVLALHCFLSATDEEVSEAVESFELNPADSEMADEEENLADAELDSCHFSTSRTYLINKVLCCPFDDAYLLSSMRKLPFDLVVKLLKFILFTMQHPSGSGADLQTDNQLSRWEAVALDAHASQWIMAKDTHELVIEFSKEEDCYVSFVCNANTELMQKLKHMLTKTADKENKVVGQYCIEVLHLF